VELTELNVPIDWRFAIRDIQVSHNPMFTQSPADFAYEDEQCSMVGENEQREGREREREGDRQPSIEINTCVCVCPVMNYTSAMLTERDNRERET
jgi:hypothetical protein